MKKCYFALCLGLLVFLFGCVSSAKATLVNQQDSIALVSVVSNGDINWKDEGPIEPGSVGPIAKRMMSRDPDLAVISKADELIATAEEIFRNSMADAKLINLADKQTVLGSRAYREAKIDRQQLVRDFVKPDEYLFLDYLDKKFPPALAAETGIQRTMYLSFDFTKMTSFGVGKLLGNLRVSVEMTVLILDNRGKKIFKKTYIVGDGDTIKVSNGVYSESELMNLLDLAINDVCDDFLDDLRK